MKLKEIKKLKKGDNIIHRRYGYSEIEEIKWISENELFGVVIKVIGAYGKLILKLDSHTDIDLFLEPSIRNIKAVEKSE